MDERPTHIDLFSGIGGFALAAQWAGFRTIAFCEIDKYCQKILAKNFLSQPDAIGRNGRSHDKGQTTTERAWPTVSSNIFDFDGTQFRRNGCNVTLFTGGFPCQPFSVAGKRRGAADDRAIWPEMFRVIREARPAWVLGENVPGIIPMELDNVLSDLESIGYACRPFVIPACAVDARHRRDRLWIVGRFMGDSTSPGSLSRPLAGVCSGEEVARPRDEELERRGCSIPIANGSNEHGRCSTVQMGRIGNTGEAANDSFGAGVEWSVEPDVGRVAHGIPSRVDRLKGLGNAIVPQVAYEILREIRNLI
jgi:DNA (cytosine-5)-methyltransferase 1